MDKNKETTKTAVVLAMLLTGVVLVGAGLWLIYPPAALVGIGAMLLFMVRNYLKYPVKDAGK